MSYAAKVYSSISKVLNEDYAGAKKDLKFFNEKNPGSTLGGILFAGAVIFEREHAANFLDAKEIDSLLYVSQDSCEVLLKKNPDDLWGNYLMALTKTYQTYWKLFQSNYIDGFADGFVALQYFEKCLSIDSSFAEAKVAIGNYKYWSSVKTESLHWLPFIEDNRESGLHGLESALSEKFMNKDFALISLGYAYLNEERYLAAIKLAEDLLKKYSKSSKIKALLAKAYEIPEPDKSIKLYKELVNRFAKENFENPYKSIEARNNLAQLYFRTGNYKKAEKLCDEVLSMPEINQKYQVQVIPLIEKIVELQDSSRAHIEVIPKK